MSDQFIQEIKEKYKHSKRHKEFLERLEEPYKPPVEKDYPVLYGALGVLMWLSAMIYLFS